ncbi:MAG: 30S ribosomal protein S20 [Opitutales bacterium]|jgi:small subunit ribosomal protein S20|nr:30S ribosomal protein S20 [Opitutales bacterium]
MANIKANKKSVRQTAARAARNKIVRTRLKTLVKGFTTGAPAAVASLVASAADKAVKSGVIHRNKANRIKARLAKKLAAAKK